MMALRLSWYMFNANDDGAKHFQCIIPKGVNDTVVFTQLIQLAHREGIRIPPRETQYIRIAL